MRVLKVKKLDPSAQKVKRLDLHVMPATALEIACNLDKFSVAAQNDIIAALEANDISVEIIKNGGATE